MPPIACRRRGLRRAVRRRGCDVDQTAAKPALGGATRLGDRPVDVVHGDELRPTRRFQSREQNSVIQSL